MEVKFLDGLAYCCSQILSKRWHWNPGSALMWTPCCLLPCYDDRLAQSASNSPWERPPGLQGHCLKDMESSEGQRSWKLQHTSQRRESPGHLLGSLLCVLGSPLIDLFQQPFAPFRQNYQKEPVISCHEKWILVTEQGYPWTPGSVLQFDASTEASSTRCRRENIALD